MARRSSCSRRSETIGGGTRTAELTLPGFHHDVCSAAHPLGILSPYFATLPLADHGLTWMQTAGVGRPSRWTANRR